MELNLLYVHAMHMGYGRMGVQIAAAMERQGITIYDQLEGTKIDRLVLPTGSKFDPTRRSGRSNIVLWLSVPGHATGWWKGQHTSLATMWEATRLPESFREHLDEYETLFVPSWHNEELFSRYHSDVKFIPLGVDPKVWHYQKRIPPERYFRFLCAGAGARKGTDLAVKAFRRLWGRDGSWGSGPIPVLQLKNPRGEDFYGDRIEMITGCLSDEEEVELYAGAHCYLGPSRGEGFGLQPLQAIAQGCPTILTNAHGHESYAHLGHKLSSKMSQSAYFIYGDAGDWWEPSFDELCEWMRAVYDNYDWAESLAQQNSAVALEQFTWNNTANQMLDHLGRDRLTPYEGPGEWHEISVRKYPVVLKSGHVCDIGGTMYAFEAGKKYCVFADAKRVLFEGGFLDPICLNDDDPDQCGLTPSQVERADEYRAEQANCPTCLRPLNREVVPLTEPVAVDPHDPAWGLV